MAMRRFVTRGVSPHEHDARAYTGDGTEADLFGWLRGKAPRSRLFGSLFHFPFNNAVDL